MLVAQMGLKGSVVALVEEEDFVLPVCSQSGVFSVCFFLTIRHSQLLFGLPLEESKLMKT